MNMRSTAPISLSHLRMVLEWPIRSFAIRLLSHPIWAHFIPFIPNGCNSWYLYDNLTDSYCDNGLPIPPKELYSDLCNSQSEFLESGKKHAQTMASAVTKFQPGTLANVLDFGCGSGRMTRWFKTFLDCENVYGTDIDSLRASWCANHLGDYGRFWTSTTHPHLPIMDSTFDLVVCGSIFTHIDDLSEAWLLEMARTMKRNGLLYVTIHDEFAVKWLHENDPNAWLLRKAQSNKPAYRNLTDLNDMPRKLVIGRFNRSQVFYKRDYFIHSIEKDFLHLETIESGYGFQTALIFQKK
jgi:ubiquinone/menaquinone biosynthesis C-methylase UbiE